MAVVNTYDWLQNFINHCKKNQFKNAYLIQLETLCEPIRHYYSHIDIEELHYYLLENGLFEAKEWRFIEEAIEQMKEKGTWDLIEQEYHSLKMKWHGPDIPIFIFPVKEANQPLKDHTQKKGGLAFKHALFLFVSPELSSKEVKSVLAHEYSHVCRLTHLNLDETRLTLKEVLILEGLGEFLVNNLYGKEALAPWINLYNRDELLKRWKQDYINKLNQANPETQHLYVYGQGNRRYPKWIGYNIGYKIVESYHINQGPFTNYKLMTKSTDEIINGSDFDLK